MFRHNMIFPETISWDTLEDKVDGEAPRDNPLLVLDILFYSKESRCNSRILFVEGLDSFDFAVASSSGLLSSLIRWEELGSLMGNL